MALIDHHSPMSMNVRLEHSSQSLKNVGNSTPAYKTASRELQESTRNDCATDVIHMSQTDSQTQSSVFAPGLYSPSGFDMMYILSRVATRPYPVVDLGAIDFDCALVLCDTFAHDNPIVYCSESFEVLTQYSREEILGRNCRFLQSPPAPFDSLPAPRRSGKVNVEPSDTTSESEYSTSSSVERNGSKDERTKLLTLHEYIARKEETQVVITNYKKDGTPFQNVLTTVPICWDSNSDRFRYIVGFQADQKTCPPRFDALERERSFAGLSLSEDDNTPPIEQKSPG